MFSKFANVLDLEHDDGRIIEIGLSIVDLETREIVKSLSFPISYGEREQNRVSEKIMLLTGWTAAKLTRSGYPLYRVINNLSTKYGAKNRLCVVDSVSEFRLFKEDNPFGQHIFNISDMFKIKTKNFKSMSLLEMLEYYGLTFKGRQHSGKDDSYNIAQVFLKLIGD